MGSDGTKDGTYSLAASTMRALRSRKLASRFSGASSHLLSGVSVAVVAPLLSTTRWSSWKRWMRVSLGLDVDGAGWALAFAGAAASAG